MNSTKAIVLLGVLTGAAIASAQHLEPHSFVRKPVRSRYELLRHFDSDPVVRARYAKHFGASEAAVRDMFSGLHVDELSESKRYLVYNYQNDGRIESRHLPYSRGERVFADANGRPVLRLSCGNPMVPGTYLAPPPTLTFHTPPEPTPVFEEEMPPVPVDTVFPVPEPDTEVVLVPPTAAPPTPLTPLSPTAPPVIPVVAAGPNLLPLLGLATLGGIATTIGGGDTPSSPPTNAVPEPAGLIAIGTGVGLMLIRRRR